jgi:ferredoxin
VSTRLHVDWTRCDGHGSCAELLPDVLAVDDFGFPVPLAGARDPIVARRDLAAARHAVRSCPVLALRLYDALDQPALDGRVSRGSAAAASS